MDLGIGLAIVGLIAGLAFWYWPRQAPISEGLPPVVSIEGSAPVPEQPGWHEVMVHAKNRSDHRWTIEDATVIAPTGAKLANKEPLVMEPENPWDPPGLDTASMLPSIHNRTCQLGIDVAPQGRDGTPFIRGTSDMDYRTLLLFLPPSRKEFSIRFTLRSSANSARKLRNPPKITISAMIK